MAASVVGVYPLADGGCSPTFSCFCVQPECLSGLEDWFRHESAAPRPRPYLMSRVSAFPEPEMTGRRMPRPAMHRLGAKEASSYKCFCDDWTAAGL